MNVKKLYYYPQKHQAGIQIDKFHLIEMEGIENDFHFGEKDRQIALLGMPAKIEILSGKKGHCLKKMHENILIDQSIEGLKKGMRLRIGTAVIEITEDTKKCFPDICNREEKGRDCILYKELRFAKVITSGQILMGNTITIEMTGQDICI